MYINYSSSEFERKNTYSGNDLGAEWCENQSTFKLWAPTADSVSVNLYESGDSNNKDLIRSYPMYQGQNGIWTAQLDGDLNGVYYTYSVTHCGIIHETCDPYAHAVGVNGTRAMVIDLSSTNPVDWKQDRNPNAGLNMTDCIIYELHIRDISSALSSGIHSKGKYLGLTETDTHTTHNLPTGLDHIKSLGVTHVHLLPVYDFGSVDERDLCNKEYNWGYDPVNYNVPEGSYSSNPYDGFARIRELKELIHTLHHNGISVIMDVVYNHVYHTDEFCMNQIVPGYFSRQDSTGNLSNGSGCGNDTASERSMVQKFIVDSVNFWADEYHIDGFRFDLVGLIDIDTIKNIIRSVHEKHPDVIFYGEGWDIPTKTTKEHIELAIQRNAYLIPEFAFFNDTIRDTIRGSVFDYHAKGYVSGKETSTDTLFQCFIGKTSWASRPSQIINYVSCHDNHTLYDRIAESLPTASHEELAQRCRLAAAFNLLSLGVPFFQAGEELLRSKKNSAGKYVGNSYRSSDRINSIKWNHLSDPETACTLAYYKGLLRLRNQYRIFRIASSEEIARRVTVLNGAVPAFLLNGYDEQIICSYNAKETAIDFLLPYGNWEVLVDKNAAGIKPMYPVTGKVRVDPLSALVLIQKHV